MADSLTELRELLALAPAFPWRQCGADRGGCTCCQLYASDGAPTPVLTTNTQCDGEGYTEETQRANAALIARVMSAAPGLIAELESAKQALATIHSMVARGEGHGDVASTAACAIDGVAELKARVDEAIADEKRDAERLERIESERDALKARVEKLENDALSWPAEATHNTATTEYAGLLSESELRHELVLSEKRITELERAYDAAEREREQLRVNVVRVDEIDEDPPELETSDHSDMLRAVAGDHLDDGELETHDELLAAADHLDELASSLDQEKRKNQFWNQVADASARVAKWPAWKVDAPESALSALKARVAELEAALSRESRLHSDFRTEVTAEFRKYGLAPGPRALEATFEMLKSEQSSRAELRAALVWAAAKHVRFSATHSGSSFWLLVNNEYEWVDREEFDPSDGASIEAALVRLWRRAIGGTDG